MQKQPFIVLDGKECGTMFVLAIMVQLLLICLSSEITALAEKADRSLAKLGPSDLSAYLSCVLLFLAAVLADDEQPWRQLDARDASGRKFVRRFVLLAQAARRLRSLTRTGLYVPLIVKSAVEQSAPAESLSAG